MSGAVAFAHNAKSITSTTTLYTGPCAIYGIFVSSASNTPTLKVSDDSTTIADTWTPAAATFYQLPASLATSLVVTVGGTVSCTVLWGPA